MEDVREKSYNSNYITALICNTCLGTLFFGYNMGVYNPTQSYLERFVFPNVPNNIVSFTATLIPIGAAIGAFAANPMAARVGRLKAFIITDILSIIMTLFTIVPDIDLLFIGRFFVGICVGLNSALVPLYLHEILPRDTKGKVGSTIALFQGLGVLIAYILGLNMPTDLTETDDQWWRIMYAFPILFNITRLVNLFKSFAFESPYYYLLQDQTIEANDVLAKIYVGFEAEAELFRLTQEKEKAQANPITYDDLLTPRYLGSLKIGCALAAFLQLSGMTGLIFYSTSIFQSVEGGEWSKASQVFTLIIGAVNGFGALVTTRVIEKYGRKAVLFWGEMALAVILALMSIIATLDATMIWLKILTLFFVFVFSVSIGAVVWTYMSEILMDLGLTIATLASWIACSLVGIFYNMMIEFVGLANTFLIFAIFCAIGTYFILDYIKETKGIGSFQSWNIYNNEDTIDGLKIPREIMLQRLQQSSQREF